MWWGGLRGAVGFSLAMVLKEDMWYRCCISFYHYFCPEFDHSHCGTGAPYLSYPESYWMWSSCHVVPPTSQ